MDNEISWKVKYDELGKENNMLRRWKMEATELLTKINSYAHKHLEIKLGQCAVDLVISMAKERDELKERCEKMEAALKAIKYKSLVVGQPGCKWGDTNHDSMSVAAGFNDALTECVRIADKALAWTGGHNTPGKGATLHEGINEKEGEGGLHPTFNLSTDEKKMLLSKKIDTRIKEAGVQRQEFAELMGVQSSTITKWLSGENNFETDTLFEIERQLNIKLFNL